MKQADVVSLEEAVMSEVERDRQRIIKEAEMQARRLREDVQEEVETQKQERIREAERKAAQVKQEAIGAGRLEAKALKMKKREGLIGRVFAEAAEYLADPDHLDAYGEILEGLVKDAVQHLEGRKTLVLRADAEGEAYLDEARMDYLRDTTNCELTVGKTLTPPAVGVVVQTPDGRVRYDNTLQTRLERMREQLRPAVYRALMGDEA